MSCFFLQGQVLEIKLLFWVLKHSLKYLPPPPPQPETPPPLPTPRPHPTHPKKIGSTSHVSLLYVDVQCNDMAVKKKKKAIKKFEHFINGSNITFSSMSVVSVEGGGRGVGGGHACSQGCLQTALTGYVIYVNFLVLQVPVLNKEKSNKKQQLSNMYTNLLVYFNHNQERMEIQEQFTKCQHTQICVEK